MQMRDCLVCHWKKLRSDKSNCVFKRLFMQPLFYIISGVMTGMNTYLTTQIQYNIKNTLSQGEAKRAPDKGKRLFMVDFHRFASGSSRFCICGQNMIC